MEPSLHLDERKLIWIITPDSPGDFAGDRQIPLDSFSRRQERIEANLIGMDCRWSRHTTDSDPSFHTIQPLISERYSILGYDGLQASASSIANRPTDFEQIGKIRIH
jgi:hypothetical protein